MNYRSALALLSSGISLLCFSSCATIGDEDPRLQRDLDDEPTFVSETGYSYWKDVPSAERLAITIDLSEQTAYFRRGDTVVGKSRVATGRRGHRTPTGTFSITEKTADKRSTLYGRIVDSNGATVVADADSRKHSAPAGGRFIGAALPYWMRLTSSGIGMHAGPIPNPGQPASHGCIRMPASMVRILFANAPIGTLVTIVR